MTTTYFASQLQPLNVDEGFKNDIRRAAGTLDCANARFESVLALVIGFCGSTLLFAGLAFAGPHVTAGHVGHIAAIVYSICAIPTLLLFSLLRMSSIKLSTADSEMLERFHEALECARRYDKQLALMQEVEACQSAPAPISNQVFQKLTEEGVSVLLNFNLIRNAFVEYDRPIRLAQATKRLERLAAG